MLRTEENALLHWLVVIPYYFFGTLVLAGVFTLTSRVLRLAVSGEKLATLAVFGSIFTLAVLLGTGIVGIHDLTFVPLVGLGVASFLIAGIDAMVAPARPLASERNPGRRDVGEPQVF